MILSKYLFSALLLTLSLSHPSFAEDAKPAPDWEQISNDDGVTTFKKEIPNSSKLAFRGTGVLDAGLIRILTVLTDTPRLKEWMENLNQSIILEKPSIAERYVYNETHIPWPLKNRDFLLHIVSRWDPELKAVVIESKSIPEHPKAPQKTGCVRGEITFAQYVLKPIDDWKRTEFKIEVQADPKGGIPGWVVNLFQKGWARKTIKALRKQIAKTDIQENQELKSYIIAEAKRLGFPTQAIEGAAPAAPAKETASSASTL